jgi:hypothetical protein
LESYADHGANDTTGLPGAPFLRLGDTRDIPHLGREELKDNDEGDSNIRGLLSTDRSCRIPNVRTAVDETHIVTRVGKVPVESTARFA